MPRQLERADRTVRRKKTKGGQYVQPQPLETGIDREIRMVRPDGILKQDIEHPLLPVQIRILGQSGSQDVCQGFFIRRKGTVGGQRNLELNSAGFGKQRVILVELDVV